MTYQVKEVYRTIQGEGMQTGRAAVFLRFSGCNLWSGREEDRSTAACKFCDTDFVGVTGPGGGSYPSAAALTRAVCDAWSTARDDALVVCTGGEPALQLDSELIACLHEAGFCVAIETNGTRALPEGVDWVCVSPKGSCDLVVRSGNELKLVHPQQDAPPENFERFDFDHFVLQPMDGPTLRENTAEVVAYCLAHPRWRVGLQTHKLIGLP